MSTGSASSNLASDTKINNMNYSPKLKKAMEEIKQVLEKHDIAGAIALHTPGHGEYFMKIDPSYSAARFESNPSDQNALDIRIRINSKEIGVKKAKKLAQDTTNMFHVLGQTTGPMIMRIIEMDEFMEKHYNPDHRGPGHSSHQTQNN